MMTQADYVSVSQSPAVHQTAPNEEVAESAVAKANEVRTAQQDDGSFEPTKKRFDTMA